MCLDILEALDMLNVLGHYEHVGPSTMFIRETCWYLAIQKRSAVERARQATTTTGKFLIPKKGSKNSSPSKGPFQPKKT